MKRWILFFLFLFSFLYGEFLFENASNLRQISTKYFEIIYSEESSNTMKRLLTYADKEYDRLIKLFGVKFPELITIVVTPDVELINGMFSSVPYNTIILYDYLDDASLLPFDDYFYNLFLHELTHAVSLNLRNEVWYFFRKIFGNWVSPHELQVPAWMIEGVTVSMESEDGDGRSNDPEKKAILAQHLIEKKFQRVDQVANMKPYPKRSGLHYIYGGLFNTYLQKKYGWDRYRMLWYNNNNLIIPYTFWFSFYGIYGNSVDEEWKNFSKNFVINDVKNPEVKVVKKGLIGVLRTDGKSLYFSELKKRRIYEMDKNKVRMIIDQSGDFFISKSNLLYLKEMTLISKTYKTKTKVFDLSKRRFLNISYKIFDIDEDKKLVGIERDKHSTILVAIENGEKKILLKGNETTFFYSPIIVGEKIYFILIESNKRSIACLDNGKLFLYKLPENVWLDRLYRQNDKILFNYFLKDSVSLSRLGILDIDDDICYLQDEDYNGGVYYPVVLENDLYYIRRMTDYDEIVVMKDYPAKINFKTVTLEKMEYSIKGKEDIDINLVSKPYNPLPYILPHYSVPLFVPGALFGIEDYSISFLYTSSTTPTLENSYEIMFYSLGTPFYHNSTTSWNFRWYNNSLPVQISLGMSGMHNLGTNNYNLLLSIGKNFVFKNGKLFFYPYFNVNTMLNEYKYENLFAIGGNLGYNQLYKVPLYPYSFYVWDEFSYNVQKELYSYKGGLSYNSGLLFCALGYGISGDDIYTTGNNVEKWENFIYYYDETKLSKGYLMLDGGLFLRLDIDGTISLAPLYFNYAGLSIGATSLSTEKFIDYAYYVGLYFGFICGYYIPFVPYIEYYYFPERNEWNYLFNFKLIF